MNFGALRFKICLLIALYFFVPAAVAFGQSHNISATLLGKWIQYKDGVGGNTLEINKDRITWQRKDSFNKGTKTFIGSQLNLNVA